MKVLAVVVTHNRAILLDRCLTYINNQQVQPDSILVINNGSSDNTSEIIRKHRALELKQENLGSAGGWHSGIHYCLENNFNACWLMDDDGYPDKNALRVLKESFNHDDSCVSSCVLKENDKSEFVFPMPKLNSRDLPVLFSTKRKFLKLDEMKKNNYFDYNFVHLFNGALISSKAISRIGNINRDYFIMGDEVDYFFKLKNVGNVRTIFEAKHYHPDVSKREYSNLKIYYLIKNTIINHNKYFDNKFLRNFSLVLIVLYRVARRNGFLFLIRLIFNGAFLIPKAIYRAYKKDIKNDFFV